jgi:hypothetical protein
VSRERVVDLIGATVALGIGAVALWLALALSPS